MGGGGGEGTRGDRASVSGTRAGAGAHLLVVVRVREGIVAAEGGLHEPRPRGAVEGVSTRCGRREVVRPEGILAAHGARANPAPFAFSLVSATRDALETPRCRYALRRVARSGCLLASLSIAKCPLKRRDKMQAPFKSTSLASEFLQIADWHAIRKNCLFGMTSVHWLLTQEIRSEWHE